MTRKLLVPRKAKGRKGLYEGLGNAGARELTVRLAGEEGGEKASD